MEIIEIFYLSFYTKDGLRIEFTDY